MKIIILSIAVLILLVSWSCRKDAPINLSKNNAPGVPSYFIKSVASGLNDSICFRYDANMRLKMKILFFASYSNNRIDSAVYNYLYNAKGQLQSIQQSEGNVFGYSVYSYNPDGTISRVSEMDHNYQVTGYRQYTYNNGQVSGSQYFIDSGNIYMPYGQPTIFKYDNAGNCIALGSIKNGVFNAGSVFRYDTSHFMFSGLPADNYSQYSSDHGMSGNPLFNKNNMIENSFYLPNGSKYSATAIYQYNKDGYPVLETYKTMYGNTTLIYRINYYTK